MKLLYKGQFNYNKELHILHTRAGCESAAFNNFIRRLSKKLGVSRKFLNMYFLDGMDRYRIEMKGG